MNTATNPGELIDELEQFVPAIAACECMEGQVETVSGGFPPHLVACDKLRVHLDRVLRSKPEWLANDLRRQAAVMRRDLSHAISLRGQRGTLLTGKPSMRAACRVRKAAKRMLDHRELLTERESHTAASPVVTGVDRQKRSVSSLIPQRHPNPYRQSRAVSLAEGARWFGIGIKAFRNGIKTGKIAALQLSERRWIFDIDEVSEANPEVACEPR